MSQDLHSQLINLRLSWAVHSKVQVFFSPKSAEASIFRQALASPLCMWAGSIDQGCAGGMGCCCLCSACNLGQPMTCGGFIHLPRAGSSPSISRSISRSSLVRCSPISSSQSCQPSLSTYL